MYNIVVDFLNRFDELDRLDGLMASRDGGLAVLYGRRRVGKTRLLTEWCRRHGGLYTVADLSAADVQRRYLAEAIEGVVPGFAEVDYRDWRGLFDRLARDAPAAGFRGPIVLDELPYLVSVSPELPSVLQRWIDHAAKSAGLVVAVAGSSQRMMQGLVLARDAPLFGRARELMNLQPIEIPWARAVFEPKSAIELVEWYAAWGGIPRYWELAADVGGTVWDQVDRLVLDPRGPLHQEPDRLLLEELPSAMEVRPLLDAIGSGAHRVTEIGSRLGRPATSMARPLDRLVEMGLVIREIPFGESERKTRRSLYKIADPFTRLWFRVVAPHRGSLTAGTHAVREQLLARFWPGLCGEAWEALCRWRVPRVPNLVGGPWGMPRRWWRGQQPEWDLVAESIDGERLLLGESKGASRPFDLRTLERHARRVAERSVPTGPAAPGTRRPVRMLFVPEIDPEVRRQLGDEPIVSGVHVVTADPLTAFPAEA